MSARRLPSAVELEFWIALEDERQRLVRLTRQLAEDARALSESQAEEGGSGGAQADVASDLAAQTVDLALERVERDRLAEVEAAMERLRAGTFGVCQVCRGPIEVARLHVLPWTNYCFRCAGWASIERRSSALPRDRVEGAH